MASQASVTHLNDDRGPRVRTTAAVLYGFSVVAVILRFWSRRISRSGFKWDDWAILAAVVLSVSQPIAYTIWVRCGLGKHIAVLSPEDITTTLRLEIPDSICWFTINALSKSSVLLFYRRVFPIPAFRLPSIAVASIILVWACVANLLLLMTCIPLRAFWDLTVKGRCISIDKTDFGLAIPDSLLDAVLLVMPVPLLWGLQVARTQKTALIAFFALGGFAFIASVIRTVITFHIQAKPSEDPTWAREPLAFWSVVELNVGIVSACLPSMRPLLKGISTGSFSFSRKSNSGPIDPKGLSKSSRAPRARKGPFLITYDEFTELRENPSQNEDGGRSGHVFVDDLHKETGNSKASVTVTHMEV